MEREELLSIAESRVERVLSYMPRRLRQEIREVGRSVTDFAMRLCEVRVRREGVCSLVIGGVRYPLSARQSAAELEEMLLRLSDGALYACRECISEGYVSIGGGVRVGVVGRARYDGGRIVGVADISSLVFRLPMVYAEYGEELYRAWLGTGGENMIIAAPPMGGKTTALASLAGYIGRGKNPRHVVIVDERCEFDAALYRGAEVDVLCGYKRAEGIELALRTMSPEVLIADEIATEKEAAAIESVLGAGVRVITSVHAAGLEDLHKRPCLKGLIGSGLFSTVVVLCSDGERYSFEVYLGGI